jgi:hypothetical protein
VTDRRLQKTIFVGCRELGLDGDARRDLQLRVTGKASMSDMSEPELKAVLGALKDAGFKAKRGKKYPAAPTSDLRLIHVLWGLLGKAGKLDRPGRDGLNAFIRSAFGNSWGSVPADVDMLRDHEQINAVIRALKGMCDRKGVTYRK